MSSVSQSLKSSNSQSSKKNNSNSNMVCDKYFKTFNLIPNMKEPSNEWSKKKGCTFLILTEKELNI